jgi:hypothetical protein
MLTIGQHMSLPWNNPNSRFYQQVANVAVVLDTLNSLIPFVPSEEVTYADFYDWFNRAEDEGLLILGERTDLLGKVNPILYKRR